MSMLFIHISIALSSLACVAYTCFAPSQNKLKASYIFLTLTLGSGAYLIVNTGSHMLKACVMGLIYVGIMAGAIAFSRRQLAFTEK